MISNYKSVWHPVYTGYIITCINWHNVIWEVETYAGAEANDGTFTSIHEFVVMNLAMSKLSVA